MHVMTKIACYNLVTVSHHVALNFNENSDVGVVFDAVWRKIEHVHI